MNKLPHIGVEPYTKEEIDRLEHVFLNTKQYTPNLVGEFLRMRDLTILKISTTCGLREGEILNLKWEDIDFINERIYINPFSNKEREATPAILFDKTKDIILRWKSIFDEYLKCEYVFPCFSTLEPMSSSAYAKRLRAISKEAGVYRVIWYTKAGQPMANKRFNSARKYFATRVYEYEKDVRLVMKVLRQKKLSSVDPYIWASSDHIKIKVDEIFANNNGAL